ncbi:MAG: LiaI-LiaF-like domain-containing protein [Bacteroidales bacterium]
MKTGSLFWGFALLLFGIMFLLRNFGWIDFSWSAIFQFWPLILILAGLAMLPIKKVLKSVIGIVLILGVFVALPFAGPSFSFFSNGDFRISSSDIFDFDNDNYIEAENQTYQIPNKDDITNGKLEFDSGLGKMNVTSGSDYLVDFKASHNKFPYSIMSEEDNNTFKLEIEPRAKKVNLRNNEDGSVNLVLNRDVIWDLDFDVAAGECDIDLRDLQLSSFELDGGASSIRIDFGTPKGEVPVEFDAAASSIKINIPDTVACELRYDSAISDFNMIGFDKVSSNTYRTPNYENQNNRYKIEVSAAVSSFTVIRDKN